MYQCWGKQKQNWNRQKNGFPQRWYINTFTTGSNSVRTKEFYNSTAYSSKPYLIHGVLPPRYNGHELSTTALSVYHLIMKNAECSVSNAHSYWAPYTLVQVHNPTAAELHYFEHCYREHFLSVQLELTLILLTWRIWWAPNNAIKWQMGFNLAFKGLLLVHATQVCERDLVTSNRRIVYCIITL